MWGAAGGRRGHGAMGLFPGIQPVDSGFGDPFGGESATGELGSEGAGARAPPVLLGSDEDQCSRADTVCRRQKPEVDCGVVPPPQPVAEAATLPTALFFGAIVWKHP